MYIFSLNQRPQITTIPSALESLPNSQMRGYGDGWLKLWADYS